MAEDAEKATVEVSEVVDKDAKIADLESQIVELEKTVDELKSKKHVCKRCGREDTDAPLRVREDIVKDYFRAILGQRPFVFTYKAFNGAMNIEFTMQHGDILLAELNRERTDITSPSYANRLLMSTLSGVTLVDKERGTSKIVYSADVEDLIKAVDDYNDYYTKLVKKIDAVQLGVIKQASLLFNLLLSQLMHEVTTADFYEGAGLL